MKFAKYLLIITLVVVCASFGIAKKYSDSPAGQGTSTVGTLSDYTCLYDAAQDFNATANTGDWTIEITSDLNELFTANFANTIGTGNKVTIKPATGVSPTITFLEGPDNAVSAHILIGCLVNEFSEAALRKMDGFTIDGSNSGSNTQDLTIQNVRGNTDNRVYARIIRVIGNSENVVVKNCKILNYTTNVDNYHYGISFDTFSTLAPNGFTVQNCYIENTASQNAEEGIGVIGSSSGNTGPTGWTITGNTVFGIRDVIRLYMAGSGTISNNVIRQTRGYYGTSGRGINVESIAFVGIDTVNINIVGNNFDYLRGNDINTGNPLSISYGSHCMTFQAADSTNAANPTYNINNNMMGGFGFLDYMSGANENYRGIYVIATTGIYNIYHNSVNMPNFTKFTGMQPNKAFAFGVSSTSLGIPFRGTLNIKNNIVRSAQTGGSLLYVSDAVSLTHVVSDYNDWAIASTGTNAPPIMAYMEIGNSYPSLSAWQTFSGQDANSQAVDPYYTSPDNWDYSTTTTGTIVDPIDLHFTGLNISPLTPGTPVGITTDFDGNARNLLAPWKGCDEIIAALDYSPKVIYTQPGAASVALTVSGGVEPYNWVVNGGVGTLDMSTGSAVTFTPATTEAVGDITITDGAAQIAVIPVSVTATRAPLFSDTMETKEVRFEIFE